MFTRNHKITALPCTIFQTPFKSRNKQCDLY
jgi:hypothetical protein